MTAHQTLTLHPAPRRPGRLFVDVSTGFGLTLLTIFVLIHVLIGYCELSGTEGDGGSSRLRGVHAQIAVAMAVLVPLVLAVLNWPSRVGRWGPFMGVAAGFIVGALPLAFVVCWTIRLG